jgi:hypothetical protein
MTLQNQSNLLARFFQGVAELAKKLAPKERAVTSWNIMSYVQKQLDNMGTINEYGDVIPAGYVLDVYFDNTGPFAVATRDGQLYKIPVFIDEQSQITMGDLVEAYMEFTPVSRSVLIKRQADGTVRWFAMPACTAFLNRSGEIDSRKLFDSFVEYAERTNDYPELDFYHLGERLVLGKADLLFRDDVNFCASGVFDDSDVARAAIKSLEDRGEYWGLSIAYLPTKEPEKIRSAEGVEIPVFNDGICRFISLLPEDTAASILTSISTKEVNRMNKKQEEALKVLTGDDTELFDAIKDKLKENNRTAAEPGVIVRSQTDQPAVAQAKPAPVPAPAPAQKPAEPAQPVKREFTDEEIEALLGSDKFKAKFGEMYAEMRKAEDPGEEEEEAPVEEPTEEVPAAEARSTDALLQKILDTLEEQGKTRDAAVQEVLDDLPSKVSKARIVRPRGQVNVSPEVLKNKDRTSLDLAAIAEQTLQNIGAE